MEGGRRDRRLQTVAKKQNWKVYKDKIMLYHVMYLREGRGDVSGTDSDYCRKTGDVLLCTFDVLTMDHYIKYLDAHAAILERMELAVMQDTR